MTRWALGVVLLAGCGGKSSTNRERSGLCPEEQVVLAELRATVDDPKRLEVTRWGPHDLKGELPWQYQGTSPYLKRRVSETVKVVRVVYRDGDTPKDMLYLMTFQNQLVDKGANLYGGPDWMRRVK